ncbi:MAG TPA: AAA family ATPase [Drouetiella sp.]
MPVKELHIAGYRSVRDLRTRLKRVNVLVGPNGCGKSNLYRTLMLLAAAAKGTLAQELASEGGMASLLWAGARSVKEKKRLLIEVTIKDLQFSIECGRIPLRKQSEVEEDTESMRPFANDPDIKLEEIKFIGGAKPVSILRRQNGSITARNMDGRRVQYPLSILGNESVLSGLRDPQKFPELGRLRDEFLNWRFYHQFRTDIESPLRQPQVGVLTTAMSNDGLDVAAALASIVAIGDVDQLHAAVDEAFPGSSLVLDNDGGVFKIGLSRPGIFRALSALELSDGTLQYLCLLAALLSPRPPALLALNEPETSIHPDLYEPLAKLIVQASKRSQVWITTHSRDLGQYIAQNGGNEPIVLVKRGARTMIQDDSNLEEDEDDDDDVKELSDDDFDEPDEIASDDDNTEDDGDDYYDD